MTDLSAFLKNITSQRGLSGDEAPVAKAVAEAFAPFADEITMDAMSNVIARIGDAGPRVMITAHLDEIGLMVSSIEEDGAIRFCQVGGVDPRILPGSRVTVYTEEGPMPGVVGAVSPHLLSEEDRKKNYAMSKLHIDLGFPAERVRELVHPGTQVALYGPMKALENGRYASKTIDDRGGVAVLLETASLLRRCKVNAQVFFVAAAQEEVGGVGATTAAYALEPDIGIAVDVTHGEMPGCEPDDVYPLDKVVVTEGPNIHPGLLSGLLKVAEEIHVDIQKSICPHVTWTDAASLQISRAGVPTALVEIPLKYMHTSVETVSIGVIKEAARLLCAFVAGLDAGWEELLCY